MKFAVLLGLAAIFGLANAADEFTSRDLNRISRIVGGSHIKDIKKWPWLVSITAYVPNAAIGKLVLSGHTYYCGASVIDKRWLLTAAHCVDRVPDPKYWTARLASIKRWATGGDNIKHHFGVKYDRKDWQQYEFGIEKIIVHEEYDKPEKVGLINDLALFKVNADLPVGPDVPWIMEVDLPGAGDSSFPADGQMCWMKGWGCEEAGGHVAYWAKEVELPIVDYVSCRGYWRINRNHICAGYFEKHKGLCQGDSGGPLVCKKGDTWVQVGIASYSTKGKPGDYYEVYTRVSSFVDWIKKTMADN